MTRPRGPSGVGQLGPANTDLPATDKYTDQVVTHVALATEAYLEAAFAADRPVVLSLPIDYRENLKLTERVGNIACPI